MDHFYEMARAGGSAIQIAVLSRAFLALAAGCGLDIAYAGRQSFEYRIETHGGFLGATDHHAIAALDAPDAARGADVEVVDSAVLEDFGAADIVFEVRIAAVDDGVARLHEGRELHDGGFGGITGRNH